MTPETFRDLKLQQAKWLAEEADISETLALQLVEKVGFEPKRLRREARLFKLSAPRNREAGD
ncbi:hypothetical protein RB623_10745 [Mesorhizobium sp. LHD-90]|uniref:hypothetical protein n=1 Tax=Mesorhizobium sp. LHD-90 TaxID=3071414 RepID=UPI0027E1DF78|nr:hypothetical protein [Mesorhizobium sp. LHD-90]MDQ6434526.1 hypothetical protein [Mesorhizobium sp. LHD-90]